MNDLTQKTGESLLQHGKSNNRVYLMKLSRADFPKIINQIYELANKNEYTKIFAKVPEWAKDGFEKECYKQEAYIPGFYNGKSGTCFMARYLDKARSESINKEKIDSIIEFAIRKTLVSTPRLQGCYSFSVLSHEHASEMANVYKKVFETYPFPIHEQQYIKKTMDKNLVYFGIRENDKLIAVSSCDMDIESLNVEMTDFATLPEHCSKGLASYLLYEMEAEMKKRGIKTSYSIARAVSYGMNITFAKHGYIYSGTLVNNTNIAGSIESMNVWHKIL